MVPLYFDMRKLIISSALFLVLALAGCESDISGSRQQNMPPQTDLFISNPDTLNYTKSVQQFYWEGRDPDGFVTGYYYAFTETPADSDWVWTTESEGQFPLVITGQDTIYYFQVKAVDDEGLEDPTPAFQRFPVLNSAPAMSWSQNSNIPDTTFTVASFSWQASDLDGVNTITSFEYALDDTSEWISISGEKRSLTLFEQDGITEGEHVLFMRAVDVAGSRSEIIRMPETPGETWYVKQPRGRYLLIDDYNVESSISAFPDRYYRNMMQNVTGEEYTYWNIEKLFPASITQFTETMKLFERVIWYTDLVQETDRRFIAAQLAIPEFRKIDGNRIIYAVQFNRGFGAQGEPLAFSPVDSLGKSYNFISSNSTYYPDSLYLQNNPQVNLPTLKVSNIIVGLIALKAKQGSIPLYRYDDTSLEVDPVFVIAGRNDNTGKIDFLFSGTPLHFLNADNNLNEFFDFVLNDLFNQ